MVNRSLTRSLRARTGTTHSFRPRARLESPVRGCASCHESGNLGPFRYVLKSQSGPSDQTIESISAGGRLFFVAVLSVFAALWMPSAALAQPSISAVLNAASRANPLFKHGGVAPGMRVTILGKNLGPDIAVQAPGTYPLPTTGGLGGVTVRIRITGTPVWDDCIVLLASATKVGIVLPNSAGTGNDELQLTYKGLSV